MEQTLESNICTPKLKELVNKTIKKINVEVTKLFGRSFGISKPSCEISTLSKFIENNGSNHFLIKTELKKSYHGEICIILQLKDAIKIGSILLGIDDQEIKEKIKTEELDSECTDGIREFSEQYSDIIDYVFRNKLPKPVNVKFSSCSPLHKNNSLDILQDMLSNEYLNFSSLLYIKGFETEKCNIFLPIQTIEDFFGEVIHEKNTNVLVTDHSLTDLRLIKKYLINTQFRVLGSRNVSESFKILQREKIHMVILDLNLPEHNSIEVCKKIKKTPYTRGIPLIMASNRPTKESVIESLQSGARDFLVKPFTKEILLHKINRYKVKSKSVTLF